jgi:hypothetical protein
MLAKLWGSRNNPVVASASAFGSKSHAGKKNRPLCGLPVALRANDEILGTQLCSVPAGRHFPFCLISNRSHVRVAWRRFERRTKEREVDVIEMFACLCEMQKQWISRQEYGDSPCTKSDNDL